MKKELTNIMSLAIEANANENYNVFIDLSGHVKLFNIYITTENYHNIIFYEKFYYDGLLNTEEELESKLKEIRKQLMKIIKL